MIRDWDLWPYRIAEGAGPVSLAMYRMTRNVLAFQQAIGLALYPTLRNFARIAARMVAQVPETAPSTHDG